MHDFKCTICTNFNAYLCTVFRLDYGRMLVYNKITVNGDNPMKKPLACDYDTAVHIRAQHQAVQK